MSAPDKIWASSAREGYGEWQIVMDGLPNPTEYTRSDLIPAIALAKVVAFVRAAEMMVKAYREESDQTITAFYALEEALAAMKGGDT
jgi:hypothetical protein